MKERIAHGCLRSREPSSIGALLDNTRHRNGDTVDIGPTSFPLTAGDLNIYWARAVADQQITFVLEFFDPLDPIRLGQALVALVKRLPILGTVVRADGGRLRRVPVTGYDPSPVVVDDCVDAPREVLRFVSRPCEPTSQPPLKILLLRHGGGDILCVKLDHVLSDAIGVGHLVALLAAEYSGVSDMPAINDRRDLWQVLRAAPLSHLLRAAFAMTLPTPPEPLYAAVGGSAEPFLARLTIGSAGFARLHDFARDHRATINDVLLTAYFRAAFTRRSEPARTPFPMMVPVDMRRYLPLDRRCAIANLSSAVFPALEPVAGESVAATLARVVGLMATLKAASPGLAQALLIQFASLHGGMIMRRRYGNGGPRRRGFISVTNIGAIDEACAAFAGTGARQVYFVGPLQRAPGFLIAVSSFRSNLHLVIQANGGPAYRAFVQAFLDEALELAA